MYVSRGRKTLMQIMMKENMCFFGFGKRKGDKAVAEFAKLRLNILHNPGPNINMKCGKSTRD